MRDQNQDLSPDKVVMVTSKVNAKHLTMQSVDVEDIIAVRPVEVFATDEKGKQVTDEQGVPVLDAIKTELFYKDSNGMLLNAVPDNFTSFLDFMEEYGSRFVDAYTCSEHYVNCKMPFMVEYRKSGYVLRIFPPKPCAVDAFELPLREDFDEHIRLEDHYINALIL